MYLGGQGVDLFDQVIIGFVIGGIGVVGVVDGWFGLQGQQVESVVVVGNIFVVEVQFEVVGVLWYVVEFEFVVVFLFVWVGECYVYGIGIVVGQCWVVGQGVIVFVDVVLVGW